VIWALLGLAEPQKRYDSFTREFVKLGLTSTYIFMNVRKTVKSYEKDRYFRRFA
jgi:hypothetical protein